MASSPAEVLYDFLSNLGQHTANHIGKRMDKAAGLQPSAPTGFQPPPFQPPPFQPGALPTVATAIPTMPGIPMVPAWTPMAMGAGAVAGGAAAVAEKPAEEKPAPTETADARDHVEGSYSNQIADGIACLACTRGHLNGLLVAIEEAQKATEAGDDDSARKHYAMAAAEIDAMVAIDWAPDKLAATRKEDVAVIEAIRDCVTEIREQLPTPEGASLALGVAKENVRFAVSPQFTDRDKAEMQERLRIIDREGNGMERGALLELDGAEAEVAQTELRKARHVLDGAQADGSLYQVKIQKATLKHLEAAAVALTPAPNPDQVKGVAELCQSCSDTFYGAYFQAMANREEN